MITDIPKFCNSYISVRTASQLEVALIALTFFCLPAFEAPKNISSLLFLVVWLLQAARLRSLGLSSPFDWAIIGLAIVLWVSPILSDLDGAITPVSSARRWTLLALFVVAAARLDYTQRQIAFLWLALMLGGIYAVMESVHAWSLNDKPYPEFRSVGHVNHSSMYTLITLAAGCGAIFFSKKWAKFIASAAILSSLVFLPLSQSIVGAVAIAVVLFVWLIALMPQRKLSWNVFCSVLSVVAIFGVALSTPQASSFRMEIVERIQGDNVFSGRDRILNSALAVWGNHPVIGTGWFSFGVVTSRENVEAALLEKGLEYDPNRYWHFAHGHNLWVTILIERGLVGVALVSALLFFYFWTFLPIALSREQFDPVERGAAVGALLVAVGFAVAGLGNTTMMNEHGHAGMALISVTYGYLRGRGLLPRH